MLEIKTEEGTISAKVSGTRSEILSDLTIVLHSIKEKIFPELTLEHYLEILTDVINQIEEHKENQNEQVQNTHTGNRSVRKLS